MTKFWANTRGNVAMTFAMSVPFIAAMVGGTVDVGRQLNADVQLQAILDAAVLAGVSHDGSQNERLQVAIDHFGASAADRGISPTYHFAWSGGGDAAVLQGDAADEIPSYFLGLVNVARMSVTATSAGVSSRTWGDACWMSMDEHEKHTIELHDDVRIEAPNCHFYGNSDHYNDVVDLHSCTNVLNARQVQSVGGGHHAGIDPDHCDVPLSYNIPSGVFLNGYVVPDPIGHGIVRDALARAGDCSVDTGDSGRGRGRGGRGRRGGRSAEVRTGGVLNPGTYCGDLTLSGNVNLRAGTYYFFGDLTFDDAYVHGSDVTIVLHEDSTFEWSASRIILSAPTHGEFAGMAVMGLNDSDDNEIDETIVDIQGVVYMPLAKLDWTNSRHNDYNNMSQVRHEWTAWIVEGASWSGDGTVYFNFPENQIDPGHRAHEGYPARLRNILPESNSHSARLIR